MNLIENHPDHLVEAEKDVRLVEIAHAVYEENRISTNDAEYLYENASLSFLGVLANEIKSRRHGDKVFFNRNFHVEPTNICVYSCSFCSYSRLIKQRSQGWEYTHEEIMDIIRSFDNKEVTEVHVVGGVMPQYDMAFYTKLFREVKKHRPSLHLKALTPVEYHYIFKKAKLSYEEGMAEIKASGVDSLPGGGAEIFDEEIREKIAGGKCSSDEWLRIHEIWHQLGMKSNATILYGHIETFAHRVDHMDRLRKLQDKTGGFQTFIPLKFRNQDNEMSHLPEVSIIEDLRNYAISRIFLDNFDHIKAYWPMLGRNQAQLALSFGVDDIDGTIDDTTKIYSMAGSEEQSPSLSTSELVKLIKAVNKKPIERDSLYNELKDYSDTKFDEDNEFRGYLDLPVL
ncbi:MAG: aminofutalosine synthase MqnE [Saprospiraceae bacterium]|nr:aminofutalosine synthase MqnE [Candidatus Vicinibacter affinis]